MTDDDNRGPLDGVRVLDLSRFIAGPLACQILGDMGADVIKVERPSGEDARSFQPTVNGQSIYAMNFNRNKRAITLNTRHPQALVLLEQFAANCDVVVENYRPGTMEAMGLGYERLAEINPRIILTSISGFGQTGPNRGRTLFDAIAQATSGLMSLTGQPDGPPVLTGTFVADYVSAFHGAMGTMLALLARNRTGLGQHVDIGCVDAVFAMLGTHPSAFAMLGIEPSRTGSRDRITVPANVYPAADGFVYIHAGPDGLFPRLCACMGKPELAADPRFVNYVRRLELVEELDDLVSSWTSTLSCEEIGKRLTAAGVPFGRVNSVAEAVSSEQVAARDMMVSVEHPQVGTLRLPGIPIKLGRTPGRVRKAPPLVGEDTADVLESVLGLDDTTIAALYEAGVL